MPEILGRKEGKGQVQVGWDRSPGHAPAARERPVLEGARVKVGPAGQAAGSRRAGKEGDRYRGRRVGTRENKLMPRKQGPTKAGLLGQCSSP